MRGDLCDLEGSENGRRATHGRTVAERVHIKDECAVQDCVNPCLESHDTIKAFAG